MGRGRVERDGGQALAAAAAASGVRNLGGLRTQGHTSHGDRERGRSLQMPNACCVVGRLKTLQSKGAGERKKEEGGQKPKS